MARLLAVLGTLGLLAPASSSAQLPPLQPGTLSAPDTFWVDPRFQDSTWIDGADSTTRERVAVWFDRQLLPGAESYDEMTERFRDAPRRALRTSILAALQELSRVSWEAAGPAVASLEARGVVRSCEPLWIVNAFVCDIVGPPAALADVPGARLAFRAFALGDVRRPDEMGPRHLAGRTGDWSAGAPVPWHLDGLDIPRVWNELGVTGRGVLNVINDFGFRLDASQVAATLWTNPSEIPDNAIDDDGNGLVDDVHGFHFDAGDAVLNTPTPTVARHIHGNTVAGIVSGRTPADTDTQLGIAPDSRWAPVAGLARFERAIEWALDQEADTYTMSFSLPDLAHLRAHWRKVVEHAALAGLFVVSGAGNFGDPGRENHVPTPRQMRIPEDVPLAVFGVAGLGPGGERPAYSSRGPVLWDVVHYDHGYAPKPDFSTVNAQIVTADFEGRETGPVNGNSFAGPHLTGILALMLEADPDLTPWRARRLLIETAHDVGPIGFDFSTGHGRVDAYAAVRRTLDEIARAGS